MTIAITQIVFGLIALVMCLSGYVQGVKLEIANKRLRLNGSTGMAVRTIKRQEVIHAIKCILIIKAGVLSVYLGMHMWEQEVETMVVVLRSVDFMMIAALIALNSIWNRLDRANIIDMRGREQRLALIQKRQTDPAPGSTLPNVALIEEDDGSVTATVPGQLPPTE